MMKKKVCSVLFALLVVAAGCATLEKPAAPVPGKNYVLTAQRLAFPFDQPRNILAGNENYVCRLKYVPGGIGGTVREIEIENLGTAGEDEIKLLTLARKNRVVGQSVLRGRTAIFSGLDQKVPADAPSYFDLLVWLDKIDCRPTSRSKARALRTIAFRVNRSVVVATAAPNKKLDGFHPEKACAPATIVGAMLSSIQSGFENALLVNGVREIYRFEVWLPFSQNLDCDGSVLMPYVNKVRFCLNASPGLCVSDFRLSRRGLPGQPAFAHMRQERTKVDYDANDHPGFMIDFPYTLANAEESWANRLPPGRKAEFSIYATVTGVRPNSFLQVSIENLNENFTFRHPNGRHGARMIDTAPLPPYIPGLNAVRGGVLSN